MRLLGPRLKWSPRSLSRSQRLLRRINAWEAGLVDLSDQELRTRSLALRFRAQVNEPLVRLLPEAFALVREAARRTKSMRHFDVQMLGGVALCQRSIAEMQTGEGKTLTATLPMYLYALAGRGTQLATVNDYLAKRDADLMRPVYELLGLTVGVIEADTSRDDRRRAYACDITYGTAKEFGFDFLRDRLLLRHLGGQRTNGLAVLLGQPNSPSADRPVGREPNFVLVDEADSILIDDAGTPLIISSIPQDELLATKRYQFAARAMHVFERDQHFTLQEREQRIELTAAGRQHVRELTLPAELQTVGLKTLYEDIERALRVSHFYQRDRQYVVIDDEICIVDEFTGRIAEGRKWRDGIHQAVEAKEGVEITGAGGQAARITVQDFFLRYPHLAGMSGTVSTSARELWRIYRLRVNAIPTNRPPIRRRLPVQTFATAAEKYDALVAEVQQLHQAGRPVIIGTRSIDISERLSALLTATAIPHEVLNAHQIAREAEIVAQAGERGRVTVSTNMAGRGTDIKLGPGVAELGGLHVICTELHDSARIDRQLIGRCGRQGDPGSWRQYLAMDDDIILRGLGPKVAARFAAIAAKHSGLSRLARQFYAAQQRVERQNLTRRQALMWQERHSREAFRRMGLDPYLDSAD